MADNHIKFPADNAAADNNSFEEQAKNIFPELHNEKLREAMLAVNKNENSETQSKLIEEALKAKFFAPVDIIDADGKLLRGNGQMQIPKDSKFNFKLIQNAEGEQYFALFTDIQEFTKWSKTENINTIVVVFPQMANLVLKRPDVLNGFVINPMTENIIFKKDALTAIVKIINETAAKMKAEREAEGHKMAPPMFGKPDNIPDSVLESLKKTLVKRPEVNEAYFCMMKENETEYYLFTLDISAEAAQAKKIADSFVGTARLFLTKYPIIALPQQSPYGGAAKQLGEPFYKKQ